MIAFHATKSSFPRSGVGTHWRTLRRPDPCRWSGWTAFPRESVGTIKYLAPQQCIDPWTQALLAKASTEHVPAAVGCAERKAKRIGRERCASRCSPHPTSWHAPLEQAMKAKLFSSFPHSSMAMVNADNALRLADYRDPRDG
jgi:hypothetical protein